VAPARIAQAWLLAREPWIVPIPGSRELGRLQEDLGSAAVERTDDLQGIDDATARTEVQGARYPDRVVDRDDDRDRVVVQTRRRSGPPAAGGRRRRA
jgi:diketogulonate reductase-like aldo/keto reductase